MKCASENCPEDSGEYVLCNHHRKVAAAGDKITADMSRLIAHLDAASQENAAAASEQQGRSE